jgi:hypothetical protein
MFYFWSFAAFIAGFCGFFAALLDHHRAVGAAVRLDGDLG